MNQLNKDAAESLLTSAEHDPNSCVIALSAIVTRLVGVVDCLIEAIPEQAAPTRKAKG